MGTMMTRWSCWMVLGLLFWESSFAHSQSRLLRQQERNTQQQQQQQQHTKIKPVKVFILAGQSNMEGHGSVEHLMELVQQQEIPPADTRVNEYREALWDSNTETFKVRDNVFLKFHDAAGNLTVGNATGFGAERGMFGPELMFGWTIGDLFAKKDAAHPNKPQTMIYLIKTAWGGRDLAIDFRPPLSGEGSHVDAKGRPFKPSLYGWTYRDMITEIQEGLDQMDQIVPGYTTADVGYEVSGVVWFQGWNDMISWPKVDEYAFNLANLIRDMQGEFGPLDDEEEEDGGDNNNNNNNNNNNKKKHQLPWLLGELGQHGLHLPEGDPGVRVHAFRTNMESVALQSEFRNKVKYVHTAQFAVMGEGVKEYEKDYHWKGRADCYFHIGKAFGEAMLDLMGFQRDGDTYH